MEVLGLRSEEIDALYDWECNHAVPVTGNDLQLNTAYECRNLCDLVRTGSAKALMTYQDDFYAGRPVLTVNSYGQGKAYYVAADMEAGFYQEVYQKILKESKTAPILKDFEVPKGVEICSRKTEKNTYIFLQNFGKEAVTVKVPDDAELLYGEEKSSIPGYGAAVLRRQV